jgi:hypothetical protein
VSLPVDLLHLQHGPNKIPRKRMIYLLFVQLLSILLL